MCRPLTSAARGDRPVVPPITTPLTTFHLSYLSPTHPTSQMARPAWAIREEGGVTQHIHIQGCVFCSFTSELADVNVQSHVGMFHFYDVFHCSRWSIHAIILGCCVYFYVVVF